MKRSFLTAVSMFCISTKPQCYNSHCTGEIYFLVLSVIYPWLCFNTFVFSFTRYYYPFKISLQEIRPVQIPIICFFSEFLWVLNIILCNFYIFIKILLAVISFCFQCSKQLYINVYLFIINPMSLIQYDYLHYCFLIMAKISLL